MKFKLLFSLCLAGASLNIMAQGYKDGVEYYKADQFENAKELLIRNLDNAETDKAISFYYLGCIAMQEGNIEEALKYFNDGITANPEYAYNYVGLGAIDLKNNDEKSAQKNFKQAEKLVKKDASIHIAIARAYYNADPVGYAKEIEKRVDKARRTNMEEADIYMFEGDMAADRKDWGAAAGKYEMATSFEEDATEGYVKGANMYFRINPKYSIELLKKLLQLNPTSALGQRELANKYYDNNMFKEAVVEYGKYVQNPNHFKQDENRFAFLLFYGGDFKQGYEFATSLLNEDPNNFTARRFQFMNAAQLHELKDQLIPMADALVAAHSETNKFAPIDYSLISEEYKSFGRIDDAINILKEAIEVIPTEINFYKQLSMVYLEKGDWANVVDSFQSYIEKKEEPTPTDIVQQARFCYYGAINMKTTDAEKSKKLFEQATTIATEFSQKYTNSHIGFKLLGDIKVQQVDASNTSLINSVALDDYLKAIQILESSNTVKQYSKDAQSLYKYIGNYYLVEMNDIENAKEYYYKMLELDPENTVLREFIEGLQ